MPDLVEQLLEPLALGPVHPRPQVSDRRQGWRAGVRVARAFIGMNTLHPNASGQTGYAYGFSDALKDEVE